MSDTRALFDAIIHDFPNASDKISESARIVRYPKFESGIVKIQRGSVNELSDSERELISSLLLEEEANDYEDEVDLTFAQRATKRQKLTHQCRNGNYMDSRFIVPNSNVYERLFSNACFVLSDGRKGLNPANLEMQLFLHLNRDIWVIFDINSIIVD